MSAQLNGKVYLQKLQTVAYLSLGTPLLFFIYFYLESSVGELEEKIPSEYHVTLLIPILLICSGAIYWSMKKYRYFMDQARSKPELSEMLKIYKTANNNRFIVYGISAMMISIGFYLTDFQPFAALFGIMVVLFSINNPNTRRIVNELRLKDKNKEIVLDGLDIP